MAILLVVIFFITVLIFFIAGKDDFGRTEIKLTKEKGKVNQKESDQTSVEDKKEGNLADDPEDKKEGNLANDPEDKKEGEVESN